MSDAMTAEMTASPPTDSAANRRYAGFLVRALAAIIDDVIVMSVSIGLTLFGLFVVFQAMRPAASFSEAFTGGFIQTVNMAAMFFVSIPYYIGFHWRFGGTPGKRLLKIRVIREIDDGSLSLGRSSARYFAQILSAIPFGAGYLMAAWNPKKQALHDTIAGTVSIVEK